MSLILCLFTGLFSSCYAAVSNFNMIVYTSSYCILFCHAWLSSLRSLYFLMRDRKEVNLEGREKEERREERGEEEGGVTIIRIYWTRKEYIFNKKQKEKLKKGLLNLLRKY